MHCGCHGWLVQQRRTTADKPSGLLTMVDTMRHLGRWQSRRIVRREVKSSIQVAKRRKYNDCKYTPSSSHGWIVRLGRRCDPRGHRLAGPSPRQRQLECWNRYTGDFTVSSQLEYQLFFLFGMLWAPSSTMAERRPLPLVAPPTPRTAVTGPSILAATVLPALMAARSIRPPVGMDISK